MLCEVSQAIVMSTNFILIKKTMGEDSMVRFKFEHDVTGFWVKEKLQQSEVEEERLLSPSHPQTGVN